MYIDSKVVDRIKEHYAEMESRGYEIFGLYLQGSQNYLLETEHSDIDSKCIILPSLTDLIKNHRPISTTIKLDNGEQVDVKDIRIMFENFKKQNINFVEILFTRYFVINLKYEYFNKELISRRDQIARMDEKRAINSMIGMSQQKLKALSHPYPSLIDKIEKYGYDPKQLHHIVRLNYFIKDYISGKDYIDCLYQNKDKVDYLKKLKTESMELKEAEKLAWDTDFESYNIGKKYLGDNTDIAFDTEISGILDELYYKTILKRIREEILKE